MMDTGARLGRMLTIAVPLALASASVLAGRAEASLEMVGIPGGSFEMGDRRGSPRRGTPRPATVAPFRLMQYEVTNAQFAGFVAETGHVTDPERRGWGYVWPGRWTKVPPAPTGNIAAVQPRTGSASTTIRWCR